MLLVSDTDDVEGEGAVDEEDRGSDEWVEAAVSKDEDVFKFERLGKIEERVEEAQNYRRELKNLEVYWWFEQLCFSRLIEYIKKF